LQRLLAPALLVALVPVAARAQVPLGGEFRVNAYTTGGQLRPAVAMDRDGSFVVVWENDQGGSPGLWGRRYDAAGGPLGGEFQVHAAAAAGEREAAVTFDASGDFLVVWEAVGSFSTEVRGRRFSRDGQPLGGEFQVNSSPQAAHRNPDVAALGDGFVVVWSAGGAAAPGNFDVRARRFDGDGSPLGADFMVNVHTTGFQGSPAVAPGGGGEFFVAWESEGQDGEDLGVFARRFDGDGAPLTGEFQVNAATARDQEDPAVTADGGGNLHVLWSSYRTSIPLFATDILARRFAADGTPLGGEFQVSTSTSTIQNRPRVAPLSDGGFWAVWESQFQDGDADLFTRRYASSSVPLGNPFRANVETLGAQSDPAAATDADGDLVVAWTSFSATQDGSQEGVYARRFTFPCQPGPTVLCLQGGRFKVEAAWRTNSGVRGLGRAVPLTADTGYFSFFNPANVEMLVKVLNGCGLTDHYWAFAGGLTNVEVDLLVTDTQAGVQRLYRNPPNAPFQPIQDTSALATCAPADEEGSLAEAADAWPDGDRASTAEEPRDLALAGELAGALERGSDARPGGAEADPRAVAGSCSPTPARLCLRGGRFAVEAHWQIPQGGDGPGMAVPLTSDTGYFWFFRDTNVEMILKVLDACPFNGRFWVFAAGLTNVRVEFTVTDTSTGDSRAYVNPQNTPFQPIQDTSALDTCP
jgi:hypothetical protein